MDAPSVPPARSFLAVANLLTPEVIDRAHREFLLASERRTDGCLSRADFVSILRPVLLPEGGTLSREVVSLLGMEGATGDSTAALTEQLLYLFEAIDVDGSQGVSWDEFSMFIISSGIAASERDIKPLQFQFVEGPARGLLATTSKRGACVATAKFLPSLQLVAVRIGAPAWGLG